MKKLMMIPILGLSLLLALLLLATLAPPVYAQGPDDQLVLGSNHTIGENETINGDVYVAGGNLKIHETAKVNGDLYVFGGNANIDGRVTGDVIVFGGNVRLTTTAVVEGDANVFGGNLSRDEGAVLKGAENADKFSRGHDDDDEGPPVFVGDTSHSSGIAGRLAGFAIDTVWNIILLIGLALLAWLVAAFLPQQMQTVGDTVAQAPLISFGMGLLTTVLGAILFFPMLLLIITVCLAIIPISLYTLLGVAALLGWLVIGQIIGERLLITLERPLPNFAVSAIVGVVVLTVVSKMPIIGLIPMIGPVFTFIGGLLGGLIALTGLGAVLLTRYGTRPYDGGLPSSSGGYGPTSYGSTPPPPRATDFSRESQAEAELKAKIKAALAEANQEDEPEPGPKENPKEPVEPRRKPNGEDGDPSEA